MQVKPPKVSFEDSKNLKYFSYGQDLLVKPIL